jgi:hypothetical protein
VRIRSVKPAFWQDPETGRWSADTQTLYMRLWAIADDVGWLEWDPDVIGALTYPYQSAPRRVRHIVKHGRLLFDSHRLVIYGCGCGHLPKLEAHQRVAGTKSVSAFQRHQRHANQHPVDIYRYDPLTTKHTVAPVYREGIGEGSGEGRLGNGRAPREVVETFQPIGSRG